MWRITCANGLRGKYESDETKAVHGGAAPVIHFVMPAFNEEAGAPGVCRAVCEQAEALDGAPAFRIGVVDDGSTDATAARISELASTDARVELLSHPANRGVPRAFRTGLEWALRGAGSGDIVVMLEADMTSDPALIPALVRAVQSGADAAVASRMIPGGAYIGFPPLREFLSRAGNRLLRARYRVPGVSDYTMFYRAYRADTLRRALERPGGLFLGRGFAVNARLLVRLHRHGARFAETPHKYRYNLKLGPSKMDLLANILIYGRALLKP